MARLPLMSGFRNTQIEVCEAGFLFAMKEVSDTCPKTVARWREDGSAGMKADDVLTGEVTESESRISMMIEEVKAVLVCCKRALNRRDRPQVKQEGCREFSGRASTLHEDSRNHIRRRLIQAISLVLG